MTDPSPLSARIRAQYDATGHVSPDMIEEAREMESALSAAEAALVSPLACVCHHGPGRKCARCEQRIAAVKKIREVMGRETAEKTAQRKVDVVAPDVLGNAITQVAVSPRQKCDDDSCPEHDGPCVKPMSRERMTAPPAAPRETCGAVTRDCLVRCHFSKFHGGPNHGGKTPDGLLYTWPVGGITPPAAPDALGEAIEAFYRGWRGRSADAVLSLLHQASAAHAEEVAAARAEAHKARADQQANLERQTQAERELHRGLIKRNEKIAALTADLSAARAEVEGLRKALAEKRGDDSFEAAAQVEPRLRDADNEIARLKRNREEVEDFWKCANGGLSAELKRRTDERDAALARAEKAEKEAAELDATCEQFSTRIGELEADAEEEKVERDALRASLSAAQEREGRMRAFIQRTWDGLAMDHKPSCKCWMCSEFRSALAPAAEVLRG